MAGEGAGMLEANPGALALVILFFLVFTLGFEYFLHWLRHALVKRRKMGLLAAVNKFTAEIMLLGVAILLLNVCEDKITSTCYRLPPQSSPEGGEGSLQPWLSKVTGAKDVQGCACCLARTEGVSKCFLKTKGCPQDLDQQCSAKDGLFKGLHHDSEVIPPSYTDATYPPASKGAPSTAANTSSKAPAAAEDALGGAKGRRRMRRRLAAAAEEAAGDGKGEQCNGIHKAAYEECGYREGYAPIVTINTLHQVHYLLFFMAVTHIITGAIVLLLSTAKLKYYAWRGGGASEDALAAAALGAAQSGFVGAAAFGGHHSLLSFSSKSADFLPEQQQKGVTAGVSNGTGSAAAGAGVSGSAASDTAVRDRGQGGVDSGELAPSAFEVSQTPTAAAGAGAAAGGAGGTAGGAPRLPQPEGAVASADPWYGRPGKMSWTDWLIECAVFGVRQLLLWNTVSRQEYSVLRASFYYTHAHTLARPTHHNDHHHHHTHNHDHHGAFEGDHHDLEHAASIASKPSALSGGQLSFSAGAHSLTGGGSGLQPEHAAGAFGPYLTEQVERDGSEVVGLSLQMWLLLLLFVVVSGVIGWATWLFLILAGALLALINCILLPRLRSMTRGGHVVRWTRGKASSSSAGKAGCSSWFNLGAWLRRRVFLLGCIKLALFFFTFVVSNAIYMAVEFGTESCFFSRTGFQRNPIPWWGIMLVDVALLLNLALYTLPLYSLTYHTHKVDKTLLQSIVRNRLREQQQQQQQGRGHGGSPLQRVGSKLRSTMSGGGGIRSHSSRSQQGQAMADAAEPQSDNRRWQQMQEALSV